MSEMTQVLGIVAMEPKGEYSSEAYYEKLNTVLYNDSTYMALKSSTGVLPTNTEYWQLIGGGLRREDIVDNLDSNDANKMLSAKQGNILKNITYFKQDKTSYIKDICTLAYRNSSMTRGLQGGCYCGNDTIACYFKSTYTIQIISLTTGQVIREYSNELFGHGNGMCKVGNYLYLLGTGNTSTNKIYKIPFDTLDSYEVIDPYGSNLIPSNSNISSICYSPNNEHFYITLGIPFPTLYCYEMNSDFTELINTYTYDNDTAPYGGFITNICHWDKYVVINYNFGKTDFFDETNFNLYKTITIDKNVGNRYYSEIEWLDTYENNTLIIGAICNSGEDYGNGIYSFGLCDLYNSYREYPGNYNRGKSTTGEINTGQNNVYVNTNAQFNVKRLGTYESPFISIYEATNSAQLDGFRETIINIMSGSDISNEGLYLINTKIVKVLHTQSNLLCRNMRFQSNVQVYVRGITPTNDLYLKETNVTLFSTPDNEVEVNVDGYNTSVLNIQTNANKIKLLGKSNGIINFLNNNLENGVVGVLNSTEDGYTDFIECRNINNVMQRGRLAGSLYTPTTSMIFFTPLASIKNITVQVGSYYINVPLNIYDSKNMNITLPDNSVLNVKITYDSTTYTNRTVLKFEITHPTLLIYDALILY